MENNKVTLHGMWASTYSLRVEIALKLKGIPYEYVEEDLQNKSQLLLQLNSVYKKIPVLVHNGKPIAESLVILEYIDETWKNSPKLLPEDPYERAQVRFWVSYINQQILEVVRQVVFNEGEAQAKAVEETRKRLRVLEGGLKAHFLSKGSPKIDQNNLDILDVILCTTFGAHEAYCEVLGVGILDPENTQFILSRVEHLRELSVIKKVTPPYDKLLPLLSKLRQNRLQKN